MGFSENLKVLRENAGLTQSQLAREIGISQVSVSQFENGERNPKITTLKVIAMYFGVTVEDLTKERCE